MSDELEQRRRGRLRRDTEDLLALCGTLPFTKAEACADESLSVTFTKPANGAAAEFVFNFSSDYPEGTVVISSDKPNSLLTYSTPLATVFYQIYTNWCSSNALPIPPSLPPSLPSSSTPSPTHMTLDSQESLASTDASECYDEDSDYIEYDEAMDGGTHQLLEEDITRVQETFGSNAIEYRIHAGIDEMDIFFFIDMSNFLDDYTASGWGVKLEDPLVILLHVRSISSYLDHPEPLVEVFQSCRSFRGEKRKVGVGSQMRKILQAFIDVHWKKLSNKILEDHLREVSNRKAVVTDPRSPPPPPHLANLLEMGFGREESSRALTAARGDLSLACSSLLADDVHATPINSPGYKPTTPTVSKSLGDEEVVTPVGSLGVSPSPPPGKSLRLEPYNPGPLFSRQDSLGAQLQVSSNTPEADKRLPSLDNGFLVQFMQYALNRMNSLNEFCVICDERHVLETGLLKPCVCTRELCVFAFQTLGVMADAAEAIATDADVVDLLIAMANAATNSPRKVLILDPYPSLVDPDDPNTLAMDPKHKDFDQVKAVMDDVVLCRERTLRGQCRSMNVKEELDQINKLAFPLMQWIIATCRAHIVLLPKPRLLSSMKTKYQFLLISSPPAKEMAFQQAKKVHGSTFAFHGSSIENWHSIMRKGLINASGTKLQMHGAAYGKGIYLSPNSQTSFGYTGGYHSRPARKEGCLAGKLGLTCLALCEVVTSSKLKKSGEIWVCSESDHVCTRFFFVYDDSRSSTHGSMDTRTQECRKEIEHAMQHSKILRKPDLSPKSKN